MNAGLVDEVNNLIQENESLKKQISELTIERDNARGLLGKAELELAELKKDKERLDFIQLGHCILCLVKLGPNDERLGYEFQVDGYQGSPTHDDVRTIVDLAIDSARKETK